MGRFLALALLCLSSLPEAARAAAPPSHAVVFVYHRFGDDRYPSTDTRVEQFKAQLDWLADNHFEVWPLPKIVQYLQDGKDVPDHVVAITVDDAFQSFYENGYPLLKGHDWPFTIFVSTDGVDSKQSDFMTWDELREVTAHGGTLANHTADHGHLPFRLKDESDLHWADRVRADIAKGQSRLETEIGKDVNTAPKLFAYPYGEYSDELVKLVNGLGYVAFGQQAGVMSAPLDPRALPRFPINEHYADVAGFAIKAAALPMPLKSVTPWDPQIRAENPPKLGLELEPGAIPADVLHCYQNGPEMDIQWQDQAKTKLTIQATKAMQAGRDRYNCTAFVHGRYYWYSHMWLLAPSGE
ncbi:MAG TPA: polysaccharide deacetylase family protein [Gammaproteobacteria bacterium]|jgi:peptidoglycan/xylan/chitin deacetylase (PgdA/CDA1 family)|nr:polysaccharide deacetylase family protein [Gammaproteobacteria bacterium]